jgi:hypothetical protein
MFEYELRNDKFILLQKILNATQNYTVTFHFSGSLGDIYWQCSLVKECLSENNKYSSADKIGIIIAENYKELILQTFREFNNINLIFINSAIISDLMNYFNINGLIDKFPIRLLPTAYSLIPNLLLSGKLQYADFIRELIGSDTTGHFQEIEDANSLEQARNIIIQNDIQIGRTVLICADNNTHLEISDEYWDKIFRKINELGWDICINSSGNLINNNQIKLKQFKYKTLKVPPQLVISITRLLGSYIGGTNGFISLQATFNSYTKGIHIINSIGNYSNIIKDKSNNNYNVKYCFQENFFKEQFKFLQREILLQNEYDLQKVYFNLEEILK